MEIKEMIKLILRVVEEAYPKAFLDGMNAERMFNGDEIISEEGFKKLGIKDILDKSIEEGKKCIKKELKVL